MNPQDSHIHFTALKGTAGRVAIGSPPWTPNDPRPARS
jgi:hypothetical protein